MKRSCRERGFVQGSFVPACIVGYSLVFAICLLGLRSAGAQKQDRVASPEVISRHSYVPNTVWNACGIEIPGQESCTSQSGRGWVCADGAKVYVIEDRCTSAGEAAAEAASRLKKEGLTAQNWPIANVRVENGATFIELTQPPIPGGQDGRESDGSASGRLDQRCG
jgi:hypothetical protein